jgi:hypothetical protein
VQLLCECDLVELQTKRPIVLGGIFAVAKKGSRQRFIYDGQNSGVYFKSPPNPCLPRPDTLVAIYAISNRIFATKLGLSNCFFFLCPALRIPKVLWTAGNSRRTVSHHESAADGLVILSVASSATSGG